MVNERVQRQIDRLLNQAEGAIGKLDWEVVRRRSQAVLSLQSNNDIAETYLEAAIKGLGELNVAVAPITNVPSTEVVAEPSAFANGRYEVKEFLGEGGKKRVYEAHDAVLDRNVAPAVISRHIKWKTHHSVLRWCGLPGIRRVAVLVPPESEQEWRSNGAPVNWLVFNPP